jgi:MFS family permease
MNNNHITNHNDIFKRNLISIYLFAFFRGFVFFFPIFTLYIQRELFTVTNVGIILAIESIGRIILEIPSGSIADLFGRKKTLIVSGIILIVAVIVLGVGTYFSVFVLAAILISLSESLVSNTDTALLYDSAKNARSKFGFKKIITWATGFWQAGATLGSLIGGIIAVNSFKSTFFYSAIPLVISVLCLFFVIEPYYKKNKHSIAKQMQSALALILQNKILLLVMFIGILTFSFTEIAYQLKPILFEAKNIPITYFGVISSFLFIIAFLGSYVTSYILHKKYSDKTMIVVSALISGILLFCAAISKGFMVPVFIGLGSFAWGIRYTVLNDMVNKQTESSHRATILSFFSLTTMLGIAVFSPFIGMISDAWGIINAFKILSLLSLSALILIAFLKKK